MGKRQGTRWTAAQASAELQRWRASGLTLAEHCRERGLNAKRMYRWRQRLEADTSTEAQPQTRATPQTRWLEATLSGMGSSAAVVVHVAGGARVAIEAVERVEPQWVATLVAALETRR